MTFRIALAIGAITASAVLACANDAAARDGGGGGARTTTPKAGPSSVATKPTGYRGRYQPRLNEARGLLKP